MDNHTGGTGTLTSDTGTARGLDLITGTVGFLKGPRDGTLVTGPSDPAAGYALLREVADRGLALGESVESGAAIAQYMSALRCLEASDSDGARTYIGAAAGREHAEAQMTLGSKYWMHGASSLAPAQPDRPCV